ncbi:ileal sodium/bile acid cotransporter [Procambarus clarkii]|uniref:ileal sodium/bile acid cotransporter n=1 Tax=Procambarus clarkii TaxID=6728 RepID=UPI001E671670|nr:ileal sodium/bile acid cotransporter-like isoform X2 [Procambarus clarkii]
MLPWLILLLGCAKFAIGDKSPETLWSNGHLETFQSDVYLETFHSGVWKVPEDTPLNLTLSLGFNASDAVCSDGRDLTEAWLEVTVVLDEDWKLDIVNKSVQFRVAEVCARVNKSLAFSGYYWGLTKLAFFLTHNDLDPYFTNATLLRDDLRITVDRKTQTVDILFMSFGTVFVLFNNINMGAQLDLKVIMGVLRRPVGPVCGFISQFTCMPLVTYMMGNVLFTDPLQRLGLFTLGCSPGGTSSNFWTLMFDGDINLSITMTIISLVAALGMMPLWMFTLGENLTEEHTHLHIPFSNLVLALVSLTVPIVIGMLIRWKRRSWAEKGSKIIKPFTLMVLFFFITVGTFNSYKVMVLMTWQMVVASLMVLICGYSFGATLATIMCLPRKQIIAVSIETAFQNGAVALMVLKFSLPSPYSDLASVPIFSTILLAGPPLLLAYIIYYLSQRFCGCCADKGQLEHTNQPGQEVVDLKRSAEDIESTSARETSEFISDANARSSKQ